MAESNTPQKLFQPLTKELMEEAIEKFKEEYPRRDGLPYKYFMKDSGGKWVEISKDRFTALVRAGRYPLFAGYMETQPTRGT